VYATNSKTSTNFNNSFMNKHFKINIHGKVQGVWFRASAEQEARLLGLSGFAQNLPDGSVYCEVEGPEHLLLDFVKWCHRGPEQARVESVQVTEGAVQDFAEFGVRRVAVG